ncbi:hypothetical protein [Sphingomonas quercus]|uniref:DUF3617 family protein n=1 Tax=Sphingomonas quercus TaxID=2842451 RepID=A0ABS6BEC8_9SPHN|nr:hypothetical protein [Sphingomonas quercus]MBU3076668.1 hypothetical protein [Sphingomonas quercus]
MIRTMIVLIALAACGTAAGAQTFAVRCKGTDFSDDTTSGVVVAGKHALDWQTYVIDTTARHVSRLVPERKALIDLCDLTRPSCNIDVTGGYVQLDGVADKDGLKAGVAFEYNSQNNVALHEVNVDYDDGRYVHIRWQMSCEKTAMPAL